jgi:hypothetical protein
MQSCTDPSGHDSMLVMKSLTKSNALSMMRAPADQEAP